MSVHSTDKSRKGLDNTCTKASLRADQDITTSPKNVFYKFFDEQTQKKPLNKAQPENILNTDGGT